MGYRGRARCQPAEHRHGFPGSIPYYVVQALILALALGSALQLGALRFRGAGARRGRPAAAGSRTTVAAVVNGVLCVLVVCVFTFDRPLFDPGSTVRHTSSGSPPVLGMAGIALSVIVCAGLGCLTLWRRRARPTRNPTAA